MKAVLDVACGGRMFYTQKNHPSVLYCDKRILKPGEFEFRPNFSVCPNVVSNFTSLPYRDGQFFLVVFDPPHLKMGKTARMVGRYGNLEGNWREEIRKGLTECYRVLAPRGTLIFKWNNAQFLYSEILSLVPLKPLFGHRTGRHSRTLWMCFFKESQENEQGK